MWVERRGTGPEVLLIAGLGDPAEVWQFQLEALADRYRLTAFDNRGAGRTPLPAEPFTVATMADDAAALLRALEIPTAHVAAAGCGRCDRRRRVRARTAANRGARAPGAETGARFGDDTSGTGVALRWALLPAVLILAFYLWIYTPRAHADGTVEKIT